MDFPINTERIVYEGGVELKCSRDGIWSCASMQHQQSELSPQQISEGLKLRAVLLGIRITDDCSIQSLVPVRYKRLINVELSEIEQSLILKNVSFHHGRNLIFLCQAASYHCKQLCEVYCNLSRDQSKFVTAIAHVQKQPLKISPYVIIGDKPEGYFEFDALLGVVRRAYESAKYILWSEYGAKKNTPSNFAKALDLIKGKIPTALYERLSQSWTIYGKKLKDYRDCIHHYAPLFQGLPHARAHKLGKGIWAVSLLLPDNPEGRSQKYFTYEKKLDAMIYGWELVDEIIEISAAIVNELPTK